MCSYLGICEEDNALASKQFFTAITSAAGVNEQTAVVFVNPNAQLEESVAPPAPSPRGATPNPPKPAGFRISLVAATRLAAASRHDTLI